LSDLLLSALCRVGWNLQESFSGKAAEPRQCQALRARLGLANGELPFVEKNVCAGVIAQYWA
jgi:hypothetical protein